MSARETAAAVRAGRAFGARGDRGGPGGGGGATTGRPMPSWRCWRTTRWPRQPRSTPPWPRDGTRGRWPACRWRSRTTCAPGASRRRAARRSSTAGARRTTPRSWRSCAPPGRSRWARRTWTSSPWAARRRTPPSARPAIRATATRCRAGAAAVRPRPWRPGSPRSRSVPTPADRSVNRPRCAASSA